MELIDDYSGPKEEILERIKSMDFPCMYCNNNKPTAPSVIDFGYHATGSNAIAFFICPNCRHKFTVIIQDVGKIAG